MSNIETEKDKSIANWIFSCYCMMTSTPDVINTTALFFLKQELLKRCNEMECTLPIIDEKIVDDGVNQFKLHTKIEGDDYYISLERTSKKQGDINKNYDRQEIYINRDCENAYVVNTMGNNEQCFIYEKGKNGYNYRAVLLEKLTIGTEKPTESQLALLNDVYEVFGVDGILYRRVMIPYESDYENGCYANEYECKNNQKYLSFSKGNVAVNYTETDIHSGFGQEIWVGTLADKIYLIVCLNGKEVPYEKCDLSKEAIAFFRKIAKVLKDHQFDVSELPTELTDQTQYS